MMFDPQASFSGPSPRISQAGSSEARLDRVLALGEATILPLVREKAITCTGWREASRCAAAVRADPGAVSEILVSLLKDAIQTSPRRGRVSIAVCAADDAIEIRISDTGLGVDPEHLEVITGEPIGSHLPVESVRTMARRLGGDLEVTRRPGWGSTFRLIVPGSRPAF
jgi:signal transduction histidine kinase